MRIRAKNEAAEQAGEKDAYQGAKTADQPFLESGTGEDRGKKLEFPKGTVVPWRGRCRHAAYQCICLFISLCAHQFSKSTGNVPRTEICRNLTKHQNNIQP